MAFVKVKFRGPAVGGAEGSIYYRIAVNGSTCRLETEYHVFECEWDSARSMVAVGLDAKRQPHLQSVRQNIRRDLERINRIVQKLAAGQVDFAAADVAEEFRRFEREYSLFAFVDTLIIKLKQAGKTRTAETYAATLSSFKAFRQGRDLALDRLTPEIMEEFQAWHKCKGNTPNTISFYNRVLRAVYNRAVDDDVIDNGHPFRRVYTGIDKTVKRALPLATIKQIRDLDLAGAPSADFARNMFLLSFYLRGMSFIDMAYLKKTDLRGGSIVYCRRKTGRRLAIAWTPQMQAILNKYPANPGPYLLPIITDAGGCERRACKNAGQKINHNLKIIAKTLGLNIPLTMYVARHSWASAAQAKGIPLAVISEGMGHENQTTTQIYLASLDTSAIDRANALILSSI